MAKKTLKIFSLEAKTVGKMDFPQVFNTPVRPDIIKRAVLSIQSKRFQPQGRDPMAGKRTTAESMGTGRGMARIPRVKGGGARAAFAPGTVGGRQAHPPKSEKIIVKKMTRKEKRLALLSAAAASASKETVASRGHNIGDLPQIPLIVTDELESLKKTKQVEDALIHLGVLSEIFRVKESRKVKAGKGKMRGRKTRQSAGPLIIVAENNGIEEAARNIPGVDVATVPDLNAEMFAPGAYPGRLTIWTVGAVEKFKQLHAGRKQA